MIPNYSLLDLHMHYNTGDMLPVPLNIGFHLLNVGDTEYLADYRGESGGYYGFGTTFNISLGVSF